MHDGISINPRADAKPVAEVETAAECVPCQTIIWDAMVVSKTETVSTIAKIHLAGGRGWPGDEWGKSWYALMEKTCGAMDELLAEMTGDPGDQRR
jgi:hypothetical protein